MEEFFSRSIIGSFRYKSIIEEKDGREKGGRNEIELRDVDVNIGDKSEVAPLWGNRLRFVTPRVPL